MKITNVEAMRLNVPPSETPPQGTRRAGWSKDAEVANPMSREQVKEKFRQIGAASVESGWLNDILPALDGILDHGFGPLFSVLNPRQYNLNKRNIMLIKEVAQ